MKNFARDHFQSTLAAKKGGGGFEVPQDQASAHDLLLRNLANHKARLKQVQSIEEKIAYKNRAFSEFSAWVSGVLAADRGGQDPIIVHMLVWMLDIGDFASGLEIGDYVLKHGLHMPDEYNRTPATVIADIIADASLKALDIEKLIDLDAVLRTIALTDGHDMPDQVRAKLHKAAGLALMPKDLPTDYTPESAEPVLAALKHLLRAFELFVNVGVKKPLDRAKKYADDYHKREAEEAVNAKATAAQLEPEPDTTREEGKTGAQNGVEIAGSISGAVPEGGEGSPPSETPNPSP